MKKWILLAGIIFVVIAASGCNKTDKKVDTEGVITEDTNQDSTSQPKNEKIIRWATNPNYPPYDWADANGEYVGAGVELLSLIIPQGYVLEPVYVPWKRAQEMAKNGEIDLLVNLRITPERSAYLAFSESPTFYNPISIFMRKEAAIPLDTWDELIPLIGGTALGDTYGNGFDEFLKEKLTVETAESMAENFEKLRLKRIDYFVSGYYMGLAYLNSAGLSKEIVALNKPVSNNSINLGFSKLSPYVDLLPEIDKGLSELEADGTLDKLLQKYLKEFTNVKLEDFPN